MFRRLKHALGKLSRIYTSRIGDRHEPGYVQFGRHRGVRARRLRGDAASASFYFYCGFFFQNETSPSRLEERPLRPYDGRPEASAGPPRCPSRAKALYAASFFLKRGLWFGLKKTQTLWSLSLSLSRELTQDAAGLAALRGCRGVVPLRRRARLLSLGEERSLRALCVSALVVKNKGKSEREYRFERKLQKTFYVRAGNLAPVFHEELWIPVSAPFQRWICFFSFLKPHVVSSKGLSKGCFTYGRVLHSSRRKEQTTHSISVCVSFSPTSLRAAFQVSDSSVRSREFQKALVDASRETPRTRSVVRTLEPRTPVSTHSQTPHVESSIVGADGGSEDSTRPVGLQHLLQRQRGRALVATRSVSFSRFEIFFLRTVDFFSLSLSKYSKNKQTGTSTTRM